MTSKHLIAAALALLLAGCASTPPPSTPAIDFEAAAADCTTFWKAAEQGIALPDDPIWSASFAGCLDVRAAWLRCWPDADHSTPGLVTLDASIPSCAALDRLRDDCKAHLAAGLQAVDLPACWIMRDLMRWFDNGTP